MREKNALRTLRSVCDKGMHRLLSTEQPGQISCEGSGRLERRPFLKLEYILNV